MLEPVGEAKREAALRRYHLVTSPSEPIFDGLTALCATICEAPIAFVGCLERDRIWLKARFGLDIDELGREWCAAPDDPRASAIGDLALDPKFAAHPYVTGAAHWRFIATSPIVADDETAIGVLAIIDTRRRRLSDLHRSALESLARQAGALFELHRLKNTPHFGTGPAPGTSNVDDAAVSERPPGSANDEDMRTPPSVPSADDCSIDGVAMPRRILVVDDVEAAATTLGRVLEAMGHETRIAHDGPKALAIAKEYRPDVILLDLGMPGMSGFVVARLLRAQSGLDGMTLIAVTGHGRDEDRRQALDAGFDHHLLKPVSPEQIRALLDQLPTRGTAP